MRIQHLLASRVILAISFSLAALQVAVFADEPQTPTGLPDPGDLTALTIVTGHPESDLLTVVGSESRQQLLVDGMFTSGQTHDLSRSVSYDVEPAGVVTVDNAGVVLPLSDGTATITARGEATGVAAQLKVDVRDYGHDPPVNFSNQIVPIFTKLGCNGGGCHGKSGGQNGFRLSLLGFEPPEDFEYLVKEARGRRLSLASPEHSLLLLKATGELPHGGGTRMAKGDPSYKLLRRWLAENAQFGDPDAAKVASIEVFPKQRIMPRQGEQQLLVIAHYTDGRTEDVSTMAKYEPNVAEMAEVGDAGLVKVADQAGDVAVMVRYQSQVAVFRATVPLGAPVDRTPPVQNFVDELVFAKLRLLGMPPSEVCDDATFLRRVTVDIAGRIPTQEEVQEFDADDSPTKRQLAIDRLLASTDYADNFANKWSAILRNKRQNNDYKRGTYAFHTWLRESLHENMPYDEFVRDDRGGIGRSWPAPARGVVSRSQRAERAS